MFLTPFTILMLSFKGTEHPVIAKEKNKIVRMNCALFICIIYLILVQMSIPKNVKVYAMNLTMAHIKRPKLMRVTAGMPAYHSQSNTASHSILNSIMTVSPALIPVFPLVTVVSHLHVSHLIKTVYVFIMI